jgi:hypothetical protein
MNLLIKFLEGHEGRKNRLEFASNKLTHELKQAPLINIQNVANYYFMELDHPQDQFDAQRAFPNVAPPWPLFYMSFKIPGYIRSRGRLERLPEAGIECGYLIFGARDDRTGGWKSKAILLRVDSGSRISTVRTIEWLTDEHGQMRPTDGIEPARDKFRLLVSKEVSWQQGNIVSDEKLSAPLICVPFLAICFCHCKNVKVEREPVPNKVRLKRERAHGWSPDASHRIGIDPMRKQLAAVGANEPSGLKRALHIMRGHFKDYREGRGLFGKVHGMWWWDFRLTESDHNRHEYEIQAGQRREPGL